eukprot:GHVL01006382.1.p1 GENE.GHVL01006382.1~~GHVL01006382.1.p1  ORF type:complete len:477 (+),score=78.30 GHVL01006382.1:1270-2700(+)
MRELLIFAIFFEVLCIDEKCSQTDVDLVSELHLHSTPYGPSMTNIPRKVVLMSQVHDMWEVDRNHIQISPETTPMLIFAVKSATKLLDVTVKPILSVESHVRFRHADGPQSASFLHHFDLEIQLSKCKKQSFESIHTTIHLSGCQSINFSFTVNCKQPNIPCKGLMIMSNINKRILPDIVIDGKTTENYDSIDNPFLVEINSNTYHTDLYMWCDNCDPPVFFETPQITSDLQVVWPSIPLSHWSSVSNAVRNGHHWFPLPDSPEKMTLSFNCHSTGTSVVVVSIQPAFHSPFQIVFRKSCMVASHVPTAYGTNTTFPHTVPSHIYTSMPTPEHTYKEPYSPVYMQIPQNMHIYNDTFFKNNIIQSNKQKTSFYVFFWLLIILLVFLLVIYVPFAFNSYKRGSRGMDMIPSVEEIKWRCSIFYNKIKTALTNRRSQYNAPALNRHDEFDEDLSANLPALPSRSQGAPSCTNLEYGSM